MDIQPDARRIKDAAQDASPWIERLGRFGFAAKGVVYLIVGVLAALTATGSGAMMTDQRGAFAWLLQQQLGRPLLGALALGLLGYVVWRFVQAGLDTEGAGTDAKGLQVRGAYVVSGLMYLGLCVTAAQLVLSTGATASGDSATQNWTDWLFEQPFGRWLVGLGGAGILGAGLSQFYRAYTAKFREKLRLDGMNAERELWVTRLGRLGFAARGVAFCIIGGFLIAAALQARPDQARGLGGALATLAGLPFGPWLLGLVALGLAAYGVYMLAEARYRRMVIR